MTSLRATMLEWSSPEWPWVLRQMLALRAVMLALMGAPSEKFP
jgi:hypothetical protein